jgi:hypothetical protein
MIEEFIRNLVVTYVPEFMIRSMVQVIFISGCVSVILVMLSIGSFFMNLSSLVNRVFVPRKVEEAKRPSLWSQFKSSKLGSRILSKVS